MARQKRNKQDREARFRQLRESIELARQNREGTLQDTAPKGTMDWDSDNGFAGPGSDEKLIFEETKQDETEEMLDETPPEMPPAPIAPLPSFAPAETVPQPTEAISQEPVPQPEEVPPEMPPEIPPEPEMPPQQPDEPPKEDTYEEELLSAEEKEQITTEVERKLQESFRESDEWWDKWNNELEELMGL